MSNGMAHTVHIPANLSLPTHTHTHITHTPHHTDPPPPRPPSPPSPSPFRPRQGVRGGKRRREGMVVVGREKGKGGVCLARTPAHRSQKSTVPLPSPPSSPIPAQIPDLCPPPPPQPHRSRILLCCMVKFCFHLLAVRQGREGVIVIVTGGLFLPFFFLFSIRIRIRRSDSGPPLPRPPRDEWVGLGVCIRARGRGWGGCKER